MLAWASSKGDWELQRQLYGWPPVMFAWDAMTIRVSTESNYVTAKELRKFKFFLTIEDTMAKIPGRTSLLGACFLASCVTLAAAPSRWAQNKPLAIRSIAVLTGQPACWKRVDLRVDLDGSYGTPFDPDEIAVDALFGLPSGKTLSVPAFLYQVFQPGAAANAAAVETAPPEWRVRFTPTEPGAYSVRVHVRDHSGQATSQPVSFTATAASGHGYVRVSKRDPHYFEFDDGAPFFLIGENMVNGSQANFERWMGKLAANGGNFVRLWIGSREFALERGQVGEYRLDDAWRLDQVVELAERQGIYFKACLDWIRHLAPPPPRDQLGRYMSVGDWAYMEDYSYRKANGGPAATMKELFTLPEARRLFRNRLRYTVARWGYSPNLMAWELWNEIDDVGEGANAEEVIRPWNEEMCRYLKSIDPWQHLTTNSFGETDWWDTRRIPENEFEQMHGYYGWHDPQDEFLARDTTAFMSKWLAAIEYFGRPYLFSEFGVMYNRPLLTGLPHDTAGVHFHNGLWAPLAYGAAGTGQSWGWNYDVDANNLYSHFLAVANFVKDIPWTTAGFHKAGAQATDARLRVMGLRGARFSLLWVQDGSSTWWNAVHGQAIAPIENAEVELAGVADAHYRLEFWDTYSGRVTSQGEADAKAEMLRFPLPRVERDLAVKIFRTN
jgi:hypothetical protein